MLTVRFLYRSGTVAVLKYRNLSDALKDIDEAYARLCEVRIEFP